MTTIEEKNIPSGGGGGGQVIIQVQLMYTLQFCDFDEEKEKKEKQQKKDTRPGSVHVSAIQYFWFSIPR